MANGITDDGELVIRIDEQQAGGESGQLILTDATFTLDRSNSEHVGIGNDTTQAVSYGNTTASVSVEGQTTESMANLVVNLWENRTSPSSVFFRGNFLETRGGKMDWNNMEWSISDDGDATLSIDANLRDFEWERV